VTAFDDPLAETGLFHMAPGAPISLADKFGVPPMSVLDRRGGEWQDRKRRWLELGITSDSGREAGLTYAKSSRNDPVGLELRRISDGSSVFDPVICELVYRWFSCAYDMVLDPFCGGSVRGVTASVLDRWYTGVDIRPEQIAANKLQADLGGDIGPTWLVGDATRIGQALPPGDRYDLLFSCPPYADLEKYDGGDRDISGWSYDDFLTGHRQAITDSVALLHPDRYAAWVMSDVRNPKTGAYRGLVQETISAFADAGCLLLNDFVILDHVAVAAMRAERPFRVNRKATRVHQHLLLFVKGNLKDAARRVEADGVLSDE
jgi:hypothetical protein